MHYLEESQILLLLVQLFILLLATRGLGEVFRRWKQPPLTAELLVGIALGPTILGRFLPGIHQAIFPPDAAQQNMLETVAWIGVLFLLLDTGLEMDFSVAWRQRGNALFIALSDIVIPIAIAFVPCLFLPADYLVDPSRRIVFALFMATVMTISAMPVTARVLHDLSLLKADIGFLIMSALAVNDIVGWVLFTIVLGFFGQAVTGPVGATVIFVATIGFAAFALTFGRLASGRLLGILQRRGLPEPGTSFTFACLVGLLFGAITQKLGVHALFGFFIAGVVMGEAKNLSEQTRTVISQMVHALFVPIFFANIGLKIDFAANFDLALVLFVTAIGVGGRYLGAWIGVGLTRVPRIDRNLISIAHTPGGMMEIVVSLVAMEAGLITERVFVAIAFSATISCVVLGPWMRAALAKRAAVKLSDLLRLDRILPALDGDDRFEVIRALSERAATESGADAARIAAEALAREQEYGTGIGGGVAIPHARLEQVVRPALLVARSPGGIEWDAPDGEPVHLIFFLLTPAGAQDVHVQILARIASAMLNPADRRRLTNAPDAPSILDVLLDIFADRPPLHSPSKH